MYVPLLFVPHFWGLLTSPVSGEGETEGLGFAVGETAPEALLEGGNELGAGVAEGHCDMISIK